VLPPDQAAADFTTQVIDMRRVPAVVLTLVLMTIALSAALADVTLVAPGAPPPTIVTLGDAEALAPVAAELAEYITAMSGSQPSISTDPMASAAGARIVLGLVDDLINDGIIVGAPELPAESFLLRTGENSVAVVAVDMPGLWFGAYELLEELGCRFFFPGDLGENVPETDTLTLPALDRIESPDFIHRNVWWAYGGRPGWQRGLYVDWQRKAKMGGVRAAMGHNLMRIVPVTRFGQAHPEYYPLIDGQRVVPPESQAHNWQPCTSNPEVIQLATDAAIAYFDENPDAYTYSLSPNDGYGWCQCDACKAQDPPEYREYANRGKGRRMLLFANAVAEELAEKHPDKCVAWYAYAGAVEPPTDVEAHPNVVTAVAHYGWCWCNIHAIEDPDCKLNAAFRDVMDGWMKVAGKIFVREYFTTLVGATDVIARDVGAYSLAADMPYFKAHNVIGVNSESIPDYGAGGLNYFLAAKLMWDADQPLEPLLEDWYGGLYGPAAAAMRDYSETIVTTCRSRGDRGAFFTQDDLDALAAKLDTAAGLTVTDKQKARVAMVREAFDYMLLARAYSEKPTKERREQLSAMVDDIEAGQRLSIDFVRHRAAMQYKPTALPDNMAEFAGALMRPVSDEAMPDGVADAAPALRGTHAMAVLLKRGEKLTGEVVVRRLGRYLNPTAWAILDPAGKTVLEGSASVEENAAIDFVAEQDGTHVLVMNSSSNACAARINNQHVALVGRTPHFLGVTPWLYFYVLDGVEMASISLRTDAPGETGRLTVRDPDGTIVTEEETGADRDTVQVKLPLTADNVGKVWSFRITGASTGVCEDLWFTLGAGTAPTLATDPSRVIVEDNG
jgi:PHD/YefM family antitoxin component YafN of YafNO toxin-antitoxin module